LEILGEMLKNVEFGDDDFRVCRDFEHYVIAQAKVDNTYKDEKLWYKQVIESIAKCGKFSSDRIIDEHCPDIWKIRAAKIPYPTTNVGERVILRRTSILHPRIMLMNSKTYEPLSDEIWEGLTISTTDIPFDAQKKAMDNISKEVRADYNIYSSLMAFMADNPKSENP